MLDNLLNDFILFLEGYKQDKDYAYKVDKV
jgi:hypothetical protein